MQFNNFKHCIMSAKIYCENIWDYKDYSACHTDNKLSFLSQERGKKYILSMNSFPCKFQIAKMHISCSFSDTNTCLF